MTANNQTPHLVVDAAQPRRRSPARLRARRAHHAQRELAGDAGPQARQRVDRVLGALRRRLAARPHPGRRRSSASTRARPARACCSRTRANRRRRRPAPATPAAARSCASSSRPRDFTCAAARGIRRGVPSLREELYGSARGHPATSLASCEQTAQRLNAPRIRWQCEVDRQSRDFDDVESRRKLGERGLRREQGARGADDAAALAVRDAGGGAAEAVGRRGSGLR